MSNGVDKKKGNLLYCLEYNDLENVITARSKWEQKNFLSCEKVKKTKWVILFGSFVWAHPEPYRLAEASSKKG